MIQDSDQGSTSGTGHIVITGNVRGAGIFAVEGKVIGNVEVETLIVSAGGQVEGNLKAATVEVRGNVKGNITARSIRLEPSSQVRGDLNFEQLAIEQGASFEGRCTPKS
jgi:cytoskeletal protein CcmA (bactofilin family)